MSGPRTYLNSTIKKLFASSGNQCAFPDCTQDIVDKEGNMIGIICHIEAAEQGGLRYNPAQTDKERAHYNNLIVLCGTHQKIIDNPDNLDKYSTEHLKEIKENHRDNYIYKPYEVPQTVIEKILNTTQHSTEHNYSVTTINKNLGNGTQVTNNAEKSEGNTFIGTQPIGVGILFAWGFDFAPETR